MRHPDRALLEHQRVAVLDAPGHYLVFGRDVDLHGASILPYLSRAGARASSRNRRPRGWARSARRGIPLPSAASTAQMAATASLTRAFVHIHTYHRRVHVHGGPLGEAPVIEGDEGRPPLQSNASRSHFSEPHQRCSNRYIFRSSWGFRVAFWPGALILPLLEASRSSSS